MHTTCLPNLPQLRHRHRPAIVSRSFPASALALSYLFAVVVVPFCALTADGAKTSTFQRYGDHNNLISISIDLLLCSWMSVGSLPPRPAPRGALKSATIDLDSITKACLCVLKDIDNSLPIVGGGWISQDELDDSPQVLVERKSRKLSLLDRGTWAPDHSNLLADLGRAPPQMLNLSATLPSSSTVMLSRQSLLL